MTAVAPTTNNTQRTPNRLVASEFFVLFLCLVVVAGFYRLVSGFLNTMRVQLDVGVPSWPEGALM